MVLNRKIYQEIYYRDNKEELMKKRKHRYANDPEYREQIREASNRHRIRRLEERARLIAEGKLPPRKKIIKKPRWVVVNKEYKLAYPASVMAKKIGKSIYSINNWTRMGLFPITPFRTKRGDRLYTEDQILVIIDALSRRHEVKRSDTSFYEEIASGWKECGIKAVDKS